MRTITWVRSRSDSDRGSAVVELAILAPLIILALSLLVWAARQPAADGEIRAAARSSARAAAIQRDPGAAVSAGEQAGQNAAGLEVCSSVHVTVDVGQWEDGWVKATVTCEVNESGLVFDAGNLVQTWTEPVQKAGRVGG